MRTEASEWSYEPVKDASADGTSCSRGHVDCFERNNELHNVAALKASYVVTHRIAKAKKRLDVREQLILPAATDICRLLFGGAVKA